MRLLILTLIVILFTGCRTLDPDELSEVQIGAEKGQVLNVLGNPQRRYRKNDTDRWVYQFPHGENKEIVEKEIWFQNGRVVYIDSAKMPARKKDQPKPDDFEAID